jgi:hypothetical protein
MRSPLTVEDGFDNGDANVVVIHSSSLSGDESAGLVDFSGHSLQFIDRVLVPIGFSLSDDPFPIGGLKKAQHVVLDPSILDRMFFALVTALRRP